MAVPAKSLKKKKEGRGLEAAAAAPISLTHVEISFLRRKIADVPLQKTHVFRPPPLWGAENINFYRRRVKEESFYLF